MWGTAQESLLGFPLHSCFFLDYFYSDIKEPNEPRSVTKSTSNWSRKHFTYGCLYHLVNKPPSCPEDGLTSQSDTTLTSLVLSLLLEWERAWMSVSSRKEK